MSFQACNPALHRPPIFAKQCGDLLAAMAAGDEQQPMQPMIVPRLTGSSNFLLNGDSHDIGIHNFQFSHDSASPLVTCHQDSARMRHYIMSLCLRSPLHPTG